MRIFHSFQAAAQKMVADFVSPRARWPQGTWQARARGVQFLCQAMTGWFRKTGSRNCYIQYIYLYIYIWLVVFIQKICSSSQSIVRKFHVLFNHVQHHLVGDFNPSEKYQSGGMIIPKIWKNKKCSKPPIRYICFLPNYQTMVSQSWQPRMF